MTFTRDTLRDLARHMEWADARMWAAVPKATPVDKRLHELLTHIHTVQHAFLTIWTGGDLQAILQQAAQAASYADVEAWAAQYYPRAHGFLEQIGDQRLTDVVDMPWAAEIAAFLGRPPSPTTVAETVFQVTSHSTYHRGQVNARLRELGVTPPAVDYIAWLWSGRPAAEWQT